MKPYFSLKVSIVMAAALVMPMAQAGAMTKNEYAATKTRINADYKAGKQACDSRAGNDKDICVEQAKATNKVALAELEFDYTGKASDRNKVAVAKAESAYAVAKEKCDDQSGNAKDVCVKEAKAVQTKALADAKAGKVIDEANKDAAAAKRDADYKVAIEKCDALTGDAKGSCVSAAKSRFDKN